MDVSQLTYDIRGAAFTVHTALGPGLLESAYENCLAFELRERGLNVQQQVPLPIRYKSVQLEVGYRIDLLVEKLVILELKAIKRLDPIHTAQLLSYLQLSGLNVGLLMNFHVVSMKTGIKRVVRNL